MRLLITLILSLLPLALAQSNSTASNNNNNNDAPMASRSTTSPTGKGITPSPLTRQVISAAQAQAIISSAISAATKLNIPENIAVVDPSGLLVAFLRMDNAFPGSIDISTKKARTAVLFNGLSSADLYAAVQPGAPLYGVENTNGGLIVFGGGVPVFRKGVLIGGVGVSGGSAEQDVEVAMKGVEGIGASTKAPA